MDIRFNHLPYLHLLWLVAALAGVSVYGLARKRRALQRFAERHLLAHLMPEVSATRPWLKGGLLLLAMAALVLASIDPRWGVYWEDVPRRGIDILFVLDVSRSMLA